MDLIKSLHINDVNEADAILGIDIEKAARVQRAVGSPHPSNPNILWTDLGNGKFDWKSKNGKWWKGKGATTNTSGSATSGAKIDKHYYDHWYEESLYFSEKTAKKQLSIIDSKQEDVKRKAKQGWIDSSQAQKELVKLASQRKGIEDAVRDKGAMSEKQVDKLYKKRENKLKAWYSIRQETLSPSKEEIEDVLVSNKYDNLLPIGVFDIKPDETQRWIKEGLTTRWEGSSDTYRQGDWQSIDVDLSDNGDLDVYIELETGKSSEAFGSEWEETYNLTCKPYTKHDEKAAQYELQNEKGWRGSGADIAKKTSDLITAYTNLCFVKPVGKVNIHVRQYSE